LTFAVFSVRARDTGDATLDTARVFTSLSLFALLSEPLASLVMSLATFLGAAGSFTRIQEFLQSSERVDTRKLTKSASEAIKVEGAAFSWDATKEPQLRGVTLTIPWKKLTMIVGPVGCGKTTLLHAFLGEIPLLEGSVKLGSTSIAYCAQNPWHGNGTIREAIVSGAFFDEKWYERVVRACALTRDLEELPMGDSTRIGSGGIALSGGQSQRIALARSIYARRDILILDDVLSGLDTSTENHVFENLLGNHGILRELGTTVVLVSSSAKRLPYSDHIICLGANGKLSGEGSFADLNNTGGYVNSLSLARTEKGQESNDATSKANRGSFIQEYKPVEGALLYSKEKQKRSSETSRSSSETLGGSPHDAEAQTSRQTGDMQIYLYYVRSVGLWASLIFVVAIAGFVFCISFPNVWVQWWAADNEARPNSRLDYWLGVYAALGGAAIVCLSVSCWQIFITMVPRTGERFHLAMLKTVLSAPMTFFVNTDSGVTINRFSQDLQLIDMELPIAALNTFTTFILCIAQMALIGYGSVYAAVSFPIVLFILYLIQKVYLRTSRQLRLMDLETKAPLYGLFEESLRGLATIRALGWQQTFQEKNHVLLDRSQRPFYLLFAVQRWLTLVLDLLIAGVAVLLIILVVELRGTVSAGGVGLALVGVIQFSQNVKLLVTFWTTLETHIGSVARIKNFTETTRAEDQPEENFMPPPDWPSAGAIELRNLCAAYG
jgi:ABC-type multidrug transport system fused ATPase/permease subunit